MYVCMYVCVYIYTHTHTHTYIHESLCYTTETKHHCNLTILQWQTVKKSKMRMPDLLTGLLRNVYADQEARVRTGHGTTDWFQIRKRVHPG